jgi:hypothetical protein
LYVSYTQVITAPGPKAKSNKLLQILGPGAPSAPPEIPPPPEEKEKPWYLGPDSPPEELIIDSDKTVKGGTLKALVERLTSHDIAGNILVHNTENSAQLTRKFQILIIPRLS